MAAAAAAALQLSGGRDPASLAALGMDQALLQAQLAAATAAAAASGAPAGGINPLLAATGHGGGYGAAAAAGAGPGGGLHRMGGQQAASMPRRSYPGAAPGATWEQQQAGGNAAMAEFGSLNDGSGRHSQLAFRASTTGASLMGPGGASAGAAGPGGMGGGLGPIGPSSASSAANRDAMAAAVASAFGDLSQQQHAAGWGGMAGAAGLGAAGGGSSSACVQWPRHFICPLSGQIMGDPVMAADGHTYERGAIGDWLRLRDVSPVTGQPLSSAVLQPNYSLRQAIGAELAKLQAAGLM